MRRLLVFLVVLGLLLGLTAGCGVEKEEAEKNGDVSDWTELVFKDSEFSFELLRTIGESVYECSDIGECLATAHRITDGDFESWYSEWLDTAQRIEKIARQSEGDGHGQSAMVAYLRASNYYRNAEFFLHGDPSDSRILETFGKSQECFERAAALHDPSIESVEIPYEETTLPGYFYRVDTSGKPRPTLLLQTGYDGTLAELYGEATAATGRGYNCLAFAGPGQDSVIREQGLPFRTDWEKVVTPVVDYALSRPEVDRDRLALMGISFGGFLAPRAAAFEHRISALVANDGVYDMFEGITTNLEDVPDIPKEPDKMLEFIEKEPGDFNEVVRAAMKESTGLRWLMENGMYVFKVESPADLMLKFSEYTMEGIAEKISCPTLVCDPENDMLAGQAKKLYGELECEKEIAEFTSEEGAGQHTQAGAYLLSDQRIFDWLTMALGNAR